MGAVIFGVMGLYLLISIGVVKLAIRHAHKHGKRVKRWGWAAALVMYLIPFWDWIPTVAMHQYYCATEAGFWVYKTVDQWKTENPGVMEGLVEYPNWPSESWNGQRIASINQRFGMLYKNHLSSQEESELFLHVWRWGNELLDKKNGEVLARRVDFSTGNGYIGGEPPVKFWLQSEHCINSKEQSHQFGEFLKQIKGAKK
jgi:hypothetical protein